MDLREFLGTCGLNHKFVINYGNFVAPLSPLLKKRGQMEMDSTLTADVWRITCTVC